MIKRIVVASASAALLVCVLAQPAELDEKTKLRIEALSRLKGMDLESNAALKGAVLQVLEKTRGTVHFVNIVRDFKIQGQGAALLEYAVQHPAETAGTEAFQMALDEMGRGSIGPLLQGENGAAVVQLIGNSKDRELLRLLRPVVEGDDQPAAVRKEAVRTLAQTEEGAAYLLDLAREGKLSPALNLAAASALNRAPWPAIKKAAEEVIPLPATQNAEPLPPMAELLQRNGDPAHGREVFQRESSACSSCHQVNGMGKDIGPALSEIGTKLGKEALYEAIVDPSSGISFGFEAWNIELKNGDELFGLITSETATELMMKTQTGVLSQVKKADIARRQKLSSSLMPSGLQLTMSPQDLVDLVEFLSSLKKVEPPK